MADNIKHLEKSWNNRANEAKQKAMTVKSEKVCKLFSVENDIKLPSSWPSF